MKLMVPATLRPRSARRGIKRGKDKLFARIRPLTVGNPGLAKLYLTAFEKPKSQRLCRLADGFRAILDDSIVLVVALFRCWSGRASSLV